MERVYRMAFAAWVVLGALYLVGLAASAFVGAIAFTVAGSPPTEVQVGQADARAYEEVTVGATAVGFSAPNLALVPSPRLILVTVETAQIRYRYDGGSPTTTSGHLAEAGDSFWVSGVNNINQFKAIRTTGTSGVLHATVH